MSRRTIGGEVNATPEKSLEMKVQNYVASKKSEAAFKKEVDKYNKEIKEDMKTLDLDEFIWGDVKVTLTETPRAEFNDLQAMEILKKHLTPEQLGEVIKTREYIDDDALESLIYSNKEIGVLLAPCTTMKEPTITLRIGKVK